VLLAFDVAGSAKQLLSVSGLVDHASSAMNQMVKEVTKLWLTKGSSSLPGLGSISFSVEGVVLATGETRAFSF
jgi:hypothetical protein